MGRNDSFGFGIAACQSKWRACQGSPHLMAVMGRHVTGGGEESVDELTNSLKGGSVSGLQFPAESHELIPEKELS